MLAQDVEMAGGRTISRASTVVPRDFEKDSCGSYCPDDPLVAVTEQIAQFLGCRVSASVHSGGLDYASTLPEDLIPLRSGKTHVTSRAAIVGSREFEVQLNSSLAAITFLFSYTEAASGGCELRLTEIERCIPLLQASFDIWVRQGLFSKRYDLLTRSLDILSLGLIVLDDDLHLVFANKSARSLLEKGDGLRSYGRTVTSTDLASAISLQTALAHVAADMGGGAPNEVSPVVAVARPLTAEPLFVSISPLGRDGGPGAVALTLFTSERDVARQIKPACQFYALSPVETRLTSALAAGRSLDEAAKELKIKDQTARSYLKQIFMKTGTNRQVDLVRMMLGLSVTTFSNRLNSLIGRNTTAFGESARLRNCPPLTAGGDYP